MNKKKCLMLTVTVVVIQVIFLACGRFAGDNKNKENQAGNRMQPTVRIVTASKTPPSHENWILQASQNRIGLRGWPLRLRGLLSIYVYGRATRLEPDSRFFSSAGKWVSTRRQHRFGKR